MTPSSRFIGIKGSDISVPCDQWILLLPREKWSTTEYVFSPDCIRESGMEGRSTISMRWQPICGSREQESGGQASRIVSLRTSRRWQSSAGRMWRWLEWCRMMSSMWMCSIPPMQKQYIHSSDWSVRSRTCGDQWSSWIIIVLTTPRNWRIWWMNRALNCCFCHLPVVSIILSKRFGQSSRSNGVICFWFAMPNKLANRGWRISYARSAKE